MHVLTINKQSYYFPQVWDELTKQQFIYLCQLTSSEIPYADVKLKMLLYCTGLNVFSRKQRLMKGIEHYLIGFDKENAWWVSVSDIIFVCKGLDFLFRENRNKNGKYLNHIVNCRLTKNLLPSIEIQSGLFKSSHKLYGPESGLTNLTFNEYIHAETALAKYKETHDIEFLHKFIAIIYRHSKRKNEINSHNYNGDIRIPFNDAFIKSRISLIEKLSPEYKDAITYWYDGCKYFIAQQFPNVFKYSASDEDEEPGNTFRNFMKLVDSMADSDVTKKDTIREAYLFDVLESLEQTSIKAQQQREEIERLKNK